MTDTPADRASIPPGYAMEFSQVGPDYCERESCEDPRYVSVFRNELLQDIKWAERGVKEAEEDLAEAKARLEALRERMRQYDQAQQE